MVILNYSQTVLQIFFHICLHGVLTAHFAAFSATCSAFQAILFAPASKICAPLFAITADQLEELFWCAWKISLQRHHFPIFNDPPPFYRIEISSFPFHYLSENSITVILSSRRGGWLITDLPEIALSQKEL